MSNPMDKRYSDEDLAEFKALIEAKLESAKEELAFTQEQIQELNENGGDQQGGDWYDDSSTHLELEMLNRMVTRQQLFIQNLQNALIRVGNKTYGICMVTGELIEKKRLLAVPHATKSVAGKEIESSSKVLDIREDLSSGPAFDAYSNPIEEDDLKTPKVITKVVRKSGGTSKKAAKPIDEEEWPDLVTDDVVAPDDWDDDDDKGGSDDDEDFSGNIINTRNMDDFADERGDD
jgi:RNA polymerase-binding transcription factor DksA